MGLSPPLLFMFLMVWPTGSLILGIREYLANRGNEVDFEFLHLLESLSTTEAPADYIRSEKAKLMKNLIDSSTDPCDDFYEYACGNFEKYFPIPEDKSQYNFFTLLNDNIAAALRDLLSAKVDSEAEDPNAMDKARIFYASCMDAEARNNNGAAPLLDLLKEYGNWPIFNQSWNDEDFDWVESSARVADLDMGLFLETTVYADLLDPRYMSIQLTASGYGLEDKEEYQNRGDGLLAYQALIEEVFKLLEVPEEIAKQSAEDIVKFESQLSNVTGDLLERANYTKSFVPVTLKTMIELFPDIDWKRYLEISFGMPMSLNQSLSASVSTYYDHLKDTIAATGKKTVANYIAWRIALHFVNYLDDNFAKARYNLDKVIKGQERIENKWRNCVRKTNTLLDKSVGAMFVQLYFDEASKGELKILTEEIKGAFLDSLVGMEWLDPVTRAEAELKANLVVIDAGYPKNIGMAEKVNTFYKTLYVRKDSYFRNVVAAKRNSRQHIFNQLSQKFDKDTWTISPAVVNAYFDQTQNRVIIPAASLQPPFYHPYYPKAMNYAGMGFFIGHEITHGFDDFGREFNSAGVMTPWWSDKSILEFRKKATCFVIQYSNFSLHGKFLEGLASKGENIADNGGVRQAYHAYQKWLEKNGNKDNWLDEPQFTVLNMSNNQIFFLQFAQNWCQSIRPEAISNALNSDHHCPGKYRVIGSLRNFDKFAKAFNCPLGSFMNPRTKCRMW